MDNSVLSLIYLVLLILWSISVVVNIMMFRKQPIKDKSKNSSKGSDSKETVFLKKEIKDLRIVVDSLLKRIEILEQLVPSKRAEPSPSTNGGIPSTSPKLLHFKNNKKHEERTGVNWAQNAEHRIWVELSDDKFKVLKQSYTEGNLYLISKGVDYELHFNNLSLGMIPDMINLYSEICEFISGGSSQVRVEYSPIYTKRGEYYNIKSKGKVFF